MSYQLIGRNQRTKGLRIKRALQVTLLLAVAFWLLYQIKQSDDKTEYAREYQNKVSNGNGDGYLGRKEKVGFERSGSLDPLGRNSDEPTETNKVITGGQDDFVDENKAQEEALNKEQEASSNRGEKESRNELRSDVHKNNGGDRVIDKGVSEGGQELVQASRGTETAKSSNRNQDGVGDSINEKKHSSDADDVQTESGESSTQGSKPATKAEETNETPGAEDMSNSSVKEKLVNGKGPKSGIVETPSDKAIGDSGKVEDTQKFPGEQNSGASLNDKSTGKELVVEQKDSDSQPGNTNNTMEAGDEKSEDVLADSSVPSLENNRVMPTNYEASIKDAVGDTESSGGNSSEEAKADTSPQNKSDVAGLQNKTETSDSDEASKREAIELQAYSTPDAKMDPTSTNSLGDSPLAGEGKNVEVSGKNEAPQTEKVESQVNTASKPENTGKNPLEAAKTEARVHNTASSTSKEQFRTEMPSDKTLKREVIESQVGDASAGQDKSNVSLQISNDKPKHIEVKPEKGKDIELSGGNATADAAKENGNAKRSSESVQVSPKEQQPLDLKAIQHKETTVKEEF